MSFWRGRTVDDRRALGWCTAPRGHHGNHLRVVGVVEPTPWSNAKAVVVTVEAGRDETEPLPVITLASHERGTRLSARLA